MATLRTKDILKFSKEVKREEITITRYHLGMGFIVEEELTKKEIIYFVYNQEYGIKEMAFALPNDRIPTSAKAYEITNALLDACIEYKRIYMN